MENTPQSQPQNETAKPVFATVAQTNEWGQITNLDPHSAYFVVKRPFNSGAETGNATSAKAKDYLNELRGFLNEHKVLAKKQMEEMKERIGDPKQKVAEVRGKVEERFDRVARQVEEKYEKIENDIEQNLDRILKKDKAANGNGAKPTESEASESADTKSAKKTTTKKVEKKAE